ncbi:hypothetical protein MCHIJ_13150 [Mycolicibacterium chitae]|nr:hypothetical protein MCHIJ_13150 [Mycolicibacterium chitae]
MRELLGGLSEIGRSSDSGSFELDAFPELLPVASVEPVSHTAARQSRIHTGFPDTRYQADATVLCR